MFCRQSSQKPREEKRIRCASCNIPPRLIACACSIPLPWNIWTKVSWKSMVYIAAFHLSVSTYIFHSPNCSQRTVSRPFFISFKKEIALRYPSLGILCLGMSWTVEPFLFKKPTTHLLSHACSPLHAIWMQAGNLKHMRHLSLLLKAWATGRFCAAQLHRAVSHSEPSSVPDTDTSSAGVHLHLVLFCSKRSANVFQLKKA